jgi:hypothetical protein
MLVLFVLALTFGCSGLASAHVATGLSTAQQQAPSRGDAMAQQTSSNGNFGMDLELCQSSGCTVCTTCQGQAGISQHFMLQWNNGPLGLLGFTVYWGDGSEDAYRCLARCGNGTYDFYHFYNAGKTYTIKTTSNQTNTSNTITMVISDPNASQTTIIPSPPSGGNIIVLLQHCGDSACNQQCISNCQGQLGASQHFMLQWESAGNASGIPLQSSGVTGMMMHTSVMSLVIMAHTSLIAPIVRNKPIQLLSRQTSRIPATLLSCLLRTRPYP